MKKETHMQGNTGRPFGILDSLSYAAGDLGCNMSFALKSTMAIFWTQYMGLEVWYSLLLIVVQVWDAINDPLIGSIIDADRRQYRRHKFLTYMLFGSVGLTVAGALCFLPVPWAPLWAQVLIFIGGYVIWDAFYTVVNVPYGSLLSLISEDTADRASLSAWRSVGSAVGNMIPMAILPFLIYDRNDRLVGERVFLAALIMGVIGFLAFQFTIRTTELRAEIDLPLHEKAPRLSFFTAFRNFWHNRPAMGATVAAMGMLLGMKGGELAVTVLFQSYFRNAKISGVIQVFSMLPVIAFTPLARRLVVRYGKKELSTFGAICSLFASFLLLILRIPPNAIGMATYVGCQLINSLGVGLYSTVSWAMMGDAIDYNEWKTGEREEGMVFSLHSFFRKLAQGVGPSLVLLIMYAIGYVGKNGGNQSLQVASGMRYLVAALYFFSALMQLLGLAVIYNLNKRQLAEMHDALAANRERNTKNRDRAIDHKEDMP